METLKIAAIGDNFITSAVFESAVRNVLDCQLEIVSRDLEWPETPFHSADGPAGAEVREYSGAPEDLFELCSDSDAIVTHLAPITAGLLVRCEKLRFIGVSRGGPTNVNMDAAKAHGVSVCNVPGRNASAVAEFTVGVMLSTLRRIVEAGADLSNGVWRGDLYRFDRTGDEMSDLTVGIVGYSHIGQRVVRLLKPFGCKILICDPYATLTVQDGIEGVEKVDIDTMCDRCDVISLHARVTPETIGMISAERIARMKKGATVINTARGSLIDETALIKALQSGHLGGAALDTFATEPPEPDNPLLKMKNVTLTPHIAGASRRVATFAAEQIAADLGRFVRGEKLLNPCN